MAALRIYLQHCHSYGTGAIPTKESCHDLFLNNQEYYYKLCSGRIRAPSNTALVHIPCLFLDTETNATEAIWGPLVGRLKFICAWSLNVSL